MLSAWRTADVDVDSSWPPPPPPERRSRVVTVVAVALSSVLAAAGLGAGIVRIPYDTIGPGETRVVNDVVTVRGPEVFPPRGKLLATTVSVRERVSALQAVLGWLDPTTDVVAEKEIRGDISPDEYRKLNVEAMNDSKSTAELLALQRLGFTDLSAGALVDSVGPKSPADAVLRRDDVIVEVDGKAVKTPDDAVAAIRAHAPGETLHLQVVRGDAPAKAVETTLGQADDGRPLLGVRLRTKVRLPFEISIDSGDVVGPSAGLAYALELLDVLTAGELTGGAKVAATGQLAPDGQVGPIGGMRQKVITVKRAGANVFIVPQANAAEARAHAGDGLQVLGVSSFDDALRALGSIQGSNALALAKPSPGA